MVLLRPARRGWRRGDVSCFYLPGMIEKRMDM